MQQHADTCLICVNTDDYPPFATQLANQAAMVIACDGAVSHCQNHAITVDVHIGDMDSSNDSNKLIKQNKPTTKSIQIADQNTTDLEKALNYALAKKYRNIHILGIHGGRFDHSVYHLQLLWRYHKQAHITWYSCYERCEIHTHDCAFHGIKNQRISFFAPWHDATVSLQGCVYPVTHYTMRPTGPSSLSNAFVNLKATCQVHEGTILVCIAHA